MNSKINSSMGLIEWAMLIVLSILWGGSYFFVEVALDGFTPFLIVAIRVAVAAVVIWLFVLAKGYAIPRAASVWATFFWMAILNNVIPFNLIVWGQTEVASGLAAILNVAAPIFTVFVAGLFLKDEPITRARLAGATIGLVGVVILIGPSALEGLSANLVAQLAILGAALSYALASVYGRRFAAMQVHPIVAASGQLLASAAIMLPVALILEWPGGAMTASVYAWASVAGLAVLSTAVAYMLYFTILERAGANNLVLVTLLIPVSAILLGYAVLGETLHPRHFAGIAVIALGLAAIDGRPMRLLTRKHR